MIPDSQLEEVRARADIVDVIGELVPLKKSGKEFKACCPFHDERTPSFYVVPAKGFYKCFGGETKVLTSEGVRPIAELAGGTHRILTAGGTWVEAPFRAFGRQQLWTVHLSRNGQEKEIRATPEHRWIERAGSKRTKLVLRETQDLRHGSRLAHAFPTTFRARQGRNGELTLSPFGVARGIVFGDGTVAGRGSVAYLCGEKDSQLLKWFPLNQTYREPSRVIVSGMPAYFKTDLPSLGEASSYLYGWLAGYFAADGCVDKDGGVYMASADPGNLHFVRDLCTRLGVGTFGVRSYERISNLTDRDGQRYAGTMYQLTLMGSDLTPEFFLLAEHRRRFEAAAVEYERRGFMVQEIERSGKQEEVFCAVVPETHAFALEDNILTGNCFGCGESGDVFSFVMKRLGLDFVEAIRYVAGKAGVEIREVTKGDEVEDPFRAHYEANAFARDFFRRMLLDEQIGHDARDYLLHRGIDQETAERFGLGYAPDEWRSLRDAAAKHGIQDELLIEVGLLTTSEKSPEPYDRFRHRIMFPIEGLTGRTIAFGGRILGTGASRSTGKEPAKYVNTSETPIYHKGENLYGMSWAKHEIRKEGTALVVEGYMDAVSLAAAGFVNVVAPLGTSFTDAQGALLSRYTRRVLLLFDSDEAGLKATFRGGDILLTHGLHPAVVTLPPGEDPDTLVRKEGAQGLRHYLDQAVDVLDRKLQMLQEHDYFSSIEKKTRALDKLLPTVRAAADPTLRDMYVSRVAERTGIRRETLEAELAKREPRRPPAPAAAAPGPRRAPVRPPANSPIQSMGAERAVLLIVAKDRERRHERMESLIRNIGPEDFTDPAWRAIFQAFLDEAELDHPPAGMDPEAVRRLEGLLEDRTDLLHAEQAFGDAIAQMRLSALEQRNRAIDQRMSEAEGEDEKKVIAEEKAQLAREGREIGLGWSHAARRLGAESRNSTERTG